MQQLTSLHIATPCHEDWNRMTPAGKGKFCASCSKQVVDFTLMSDTQILHFLSQQKSSLCGRFDAGQLARPLVQPTLSKKKSWYLALALPFSLFFQKSFGQKGERTVGKLAVRVEQKPTPHPVRILMGAPAMIAPRWITLHGTVRDDEGNAMAYASVIEKGTSYSTASVSTGQFSIKLPGNRDSVILVASFVGFNSIEKKVSLDDADTAINLNFITKPVLLGDVVVAGYVTKQYTGMMGGLSICRRVTKAEKTDSLLKKTLRLHTFTVYPNPAHIGSQLQITVKKKGDYELQLLSDGSALLRIEVMSVQSDNTTMPFQLPPNLATGVYYLRLLNVNNKISYLEKILID